MTNGRNAPYPVFVTSTGYSINYRVLSPETVPLIEQAVRRDLADQRPVPPVQQVEVGPGEFKEVANEGHPDFIAALQEWDAAVNAERGVRTKALMEDYALIFDVDEAAVATHRAAMARVGVDLGEATDAQVFLWHIACPDPQDMQDLFAEVLAGRRIAALIRDQQATFRRDSGRHAA